MSKGAHAFLGPWYKGGRKDAPSPGEAAGEAVPGNGCRPTWMVASEWFGAGGLCLPVVVNRVK